jgi:lipopolysaccharide/colanic/teichoic acid biosynthesis glycosyltransferase
MMALFSPVFIAAVILLKMATRLSVFYPQERVGFKGKIFKVYKLRTLEADGKTPVRLGKIPLGKILRVTAIDEIPQLWNVLVGEMSVFGPRPRIRSEVASNPEYLEKVLGRRIPGFLSLLKAETGAGKGLGVHEIPYEIIFNEFEIGHWSWILMTKIVWKTFWVLLRDTVSPGSFPTEKVVEKIRSQSEKFTVGKTEESAQAERSELRQKPVPGQLAGASSLVQETGYPTFSPRPELWDFQFEVAGHPWSYLLDVLGFRPLNGQTRLVSGAMDVLMDPERA